LVDVSFAPEMLANFKLFVLSGCSGLSFQNAPYTLRNVYVYK